MLQATGYPAEIADFYSAISAGYWGFFLVPKIVRLVMDDRLVPSNDPRNNSGKHFGSSSLLLSKLTNSRFILSTVGAARKVFSHWSQKTITHHCLSLFTTISRLGYRTNWLLVLGELPHDLSYSVITSAILVSQNNKTAPVGFEPFLL